MWTVPRRGFLSAVAATAASATGGCSDRFGAEVRRFVVRARRVESPPDDATVGDAERAGLTGVGFLLDVLRMVVDPGAETPRRYERNDDVRVTRGTDPDSGLPYVWLEVDYPDRDFGALTEQPTYDRDGTGLYEWVYVEYRGEPVLLRYRTLVTTP